MTYKENITAILECCFAGFKEEIIDSACNRILGLKPKNSGNEILELEQEPFINKPCISKGVCHEDKIKVLDKIINEIKTLTNGAEPEHVWNIDVLAIIDKYKAESEE